MLLSILKAGLKIYIFPSSHWFQFLAVKVEFDLSLRCLILTVFIQSLQQNRDA